MLQRFYYELYDKQGDYYDIFDRLSSSNHPVARSRTPQLAQRIADMLNDSASPSEIKATPSK